LQALRGRGPVHFLRESLPLAAVQRHRGRGALADDLDITAGALAVAEAHGGLAVGPRDLVRTERLVAPFGQLEGALLPVAVGRGITETEPDLPARLRLDPAGLTAEAEIDARQHRRQTRQAGAGRPLTLRVTRLIRIEMSTHNRTPLIGLNDISSR